MKPTFKRLMAGAAAAATLLSGLALTGAAAAAEEAKTPAQMLAVKQSLTVTSADGALTGKTLYAVPLALYTDQFQHQSVKVDGEDKPADLVTSYTISTYAPSASDNKDLPKLNDAGTKYVTADGKGETDDPDKAAKVKGNEFVRAIFDAAKQSDVSSVVKGDGVNLNDKSTLSPTEPMQWVAENLLDSVAVDAPGVSYKGNLRNFLIHLRDNAKLYDTTDDKGNVVKGWITTYGKKLDIDATKDNAGKSATASDLIPGIYVVFDLSASTEAGAKSGPTASIEMMTGTQIDGLDFGVVKTAAKGDEPAVYTRMPKGSIEYKPVSPVIDKNIVETTKNDKNEDVETRTKANEAAEGDLIRYELTTYVPNYTGYKTYYLKMHDVLSKGLTYYHNAQKADDANNMKVTIAPRLKDKDGKADYATTADKGLRTLTAMASDAKDKATADYALETSEYKKPEDVASDPYDGGTNIDLTFGAIKKVTGEGRNAKTTYSSDVIAPTIGEGQNKTLAFPVGAKITVTYYARLNGNAVIADAGNPNKVHLEYSNEPRSDSHGTTEDHEVKTYTGAFDLHKVDAAGKNLKDAKFKVYGTKIEKDQLAQDKTVKDEDNQLKFIEVTKKVQDPEHADDPTKKIDVFDYYRPATAEEQDDKKITKVDEVTVPEDGILPFKGLDGTYWLDETYSPLKGYKTVEGKKVPKDPKVNFTVTITMDKYTAEDQETKGPNATAKVGDFKLDKDNKASYTVTSVDNTKNNLVVMEKTADKNSTLTNVDHTVRVMNVNSLFQMPKTGATWLVIYAVTALFLASGSFLLLRSRKA